MSLPPPIRKLKLCYVTDRKTLAGSEDRQIRLLLEKMESAAQAGVDWIQIREKDLSGRQLLALAGEALRRVPSSCRILINDRLDVAAAAGAAGAHLGEQSLPVEEARIFVREKNLGHGFLIGASVHSLESATVAEKCGADYLIFGTVFRTPSKEGFGAPQGTAKLAEICRAVSVPVFAIGGITAENAAECAAADAAGIAAIRLFQDAPDVSAVVRQFHG